MVAAQRMTEDSLVESSAGNRLAVATFGLALVGAVASPLAGGLGLLISIAALVLALWRLRRPGTTGHYRGLLLAALVIAVVSIGVSLAMSVMVGGLTTSGT